MKKARPVFKLNDKNNLLINKNGNRNKEFWSFMKPTFSFMEVVSFVDVKHGQETIKKPSRGWFKCRQTGEEVIKKIKVDKHQ